MFVAKGLKTPCYAVIFASVKGKAEGYSEMAEQMDALVRNQPGFIAMESSRSQSGEGITVCYWESIEAIKHWKENTLHQQAQALGKAGWYSEYAVRVASVVESYEW